MGLIVDGLIRISVQEFLDLTFIHHMSWVDETLKEELLALGVKATSAGYCEWKSTEAPQVSIGWTWFRLECQQHPLLGPDGLRTNLMLRCVNGYDMGREVSENLLVTWLSCSAWQSHCP